MRKVYGRAQLARIKRDKAIINEYNQGIAQLEPDEPKYKVINALMQKYNIFSRTTIWNILKRYENEK